MGLAKDEKELKGGTAGGGGRGAIQYIPSFLCLLHLKALIESCVQLTDEESAPKDVLKSELPRYFQLEQTNRACLFDPHACVQTVHRLQQSSQSADLVLVLFVMDFFTSCFVCVQPYRTNASNIS